MTDPAVEALAVKFLKLLKEYEEQKKPPTTVEYIWIEDASSVKMSSKSRNIGEKSIGSIEDVPEWFYYPNTHPLSVRNRNVGYLRPVLAKRDPFRSKDDFMTLCETSIPHNQRPVSSQHRSMCITRMRTAKVQKLDCIFKIEQEFSFREIPLFTKKIEHKNFTRKVLESFYTACIKAELSIKSFSIQNHPNGFACYEIGPCNGVEIGDQLWMSRYILQRVAEKFHLTPYFGPVAYDKKSYYPRALYHIATSEMLSEPGKTSFHDVFKPVIDKIKWQFDRNWYSYNQSYAYIEGTEWLRDNLDEFSKVVTTSAFTKQNAVGYIIDQRPRGNSDPYVVIRTIFETLSLTLPPSP